MPRLSHRVRRMQRNDHPVLLTSDLIKNLVADPFPSGREQEESLLLLIGNDLSERDPNVWFQLPVGKADYVTAWVGAFSRNSLFEIVRQLRDADLIEWPDDGSLNSVRMKLTGWDRYKEIKRSPSQARLAFMAMPFDDSELDQDFFKNAAAQTGYELCRVDEKQPAGLIEYGFLLVDTANLPNLTYADFSDDALGTVIGGTVTATPLPSALPLFGCALFGLIAFDWRRHNLCQRCA